MAKAKKKTNKKITNKSAKVAPKKTTKKVETKKEIVKEENTSKVFKDFTLLVIILLGVFLVIYGLTLGAHKLGWFDNRYTKPELEEAKIDYENINAGTMFKREEKEYFVLIGDFSENSLYINQIVSNYKAKEKALKVYKVDLSNGMNSYLKGEKSITNYSYPQELQINDYTLIKVVNNNNAASYVGVDKISEVLK